MPRFTSPAFGFALLAALAVFAVAAFAPALLNDSDTYWHIRAGEWVLDHHAILRTDPFSYTRAGAPWHTQEWLAEVAEALAWRGAGWAGIHLVFASAAGLAAGMVGYFVRRRLDLVPALLTAVLGLACLSPSLLARPHLLALPLLAIWAAGLANAREQDRKPSLWLILVMPVWANLHGSFAFGLALCAALGLEAALAAPDRKTAVIGWGGFFLLASASALLTPFWLQGLLFPFQLNGMHGLAHIGEWQATDFSQISPLAIALLAGLFVLSTGRVAVPWFRMLLLLGLVWLAMSHQRHQMLLAICGPILLAPSLARAWAAKPGKAAPGLALAAVLGLVALTAARLFVPVARTDDAVTPAAALAQVPAALRAEPVLNDYAFGGYLIWSGVRSYIDSRADLYGDAYLASYDAITSPDAQALTTALNQRHIAWTIFTTGAPVVKLIETQPGWRRLYSDRFATVDVRD